MHSSDAVELGEGGRVAPGEVHFGGDPADGPEQPLVLVLDFLLAEGVAEFELPVALGGVGGLPVRDHGHLGAGQLLHQSLVLLPDLVETLLVVVARDVG